MDLQRQLIIEFCSYVIEEHDNCTLLSALMLHCILFSIALRQKYIYCNYLYDIILQSHDTSTVIHCSNRGIKSFIQLISIQMNMHSGITNYLF